MKRLLVLAFLLGLLALVLLGGATASEETHCYVLGDFCVIISNVCYLEAVDCGDGRTYESQYLWKSGWCRAAVYAGVIVGTVEDCVEARAQTVAEKTPVSSVNGLQVLWQAQYHYFNANQDRRSSVNGNQRSQGQGGQQQGQGGQQQGDQQLDQTDQQDQTNQQGQQILLQPDNDPDDRLPEIPPDNQQDQQQLLQQILQKQQGQERSDGGGPRGESQGLPQTNKHGHYYCDTREGRKAQTADTGPGCIVRNPGPTCGGSTSSSNTDRPNWRPCASGNNCRWERTQVFSGQHNLVRKWICDGEEVAAGSTSCPDNANSPVQVVVSTKPTRTWWTYRCG